MANTQKVCNSRTRRSRGRRILCSHFSISIMPCTAKCEKIVQWNSKFENSLFKVVEFSVKDLIQATNLDRFSARPNEFAKTLMTQMSFEDFLTKILSVRSKIGTKRIWFSSRSYYVCGLVLKYFLQSAENLWTLLLCHALTQILRWYCVWRKNHAVIGERRRILELSAFLLPEF